MGKCKYIFLDFDGVLNSLPYLEGIRKEHHEKWGDLASLKQVATWKEDMSCYLDPKNIDLVNQLLHKLGWPDVVIHSSWREYYTLEELRYILSYRGFAGNVVDVTSPFHRDRNASIRWWMDNNFVKMEDIVFLEDLPLNSDLASRQVKTCWYTTGFNEDNLKIALELFGVSY